MQNLRTADIIISIVIVGYCIWSLYSSFKQFKKSETLRNEYKDNHKKFEELDSSKPYAIMYAVASLICLFLAIHPIVVNEHIFVTRVALASLSIILVAMILDTMVKRRIIFDEKGFVYETAYYHFRSVMNVTYDKGIAKNTVISSSEVKRITISKKMGEAFKTHYAEWKNRKKKK